MISTVCATCGAPVLAASVAELAEALDAHHAAAHRSVYASPPPAPAIEISAPCPGSRGRYVCGCRCPRCRRAEMIYGRTRRLRLKWAPLLAERRQLRARVLG